MREDWICVRQGRDPTAALAWVVDTERGALIFDGPTELRISPTEINMSSQVAIKLVATVADEGGARSAVRTQSWLGSSRQWAPHAVDRMARTSHHKLLASKTVLVPRLRAWSFSVVDGKIVKPGVPKTSNSDAPSCFLVDSDTRFMVAATVRTGGFLRQLRQTAEPPDLVGTSPHRLSRLPIVEPRNRGRAERSTATTLEIPISPLMPYARLIRTNSSSRPTKDRCTGSNTI